MKTIIAGSRNTRKSDWTVQQAIVLYETIEALLQKFDRANKLSGKHLTTVNEHTPASTRLP